MPTDGNVIALIRLALFVCATITMLGPTAGQAQDSLAISRLINQGRIAEAEAVLNRTAPSAAERLFFQGQVLKAQGRLPAAIETFRAVLRLEPDYLNARRELAHSQMLNRDFGAARDQFTALLDIDPDPQMRDGYRRFLATIDQNRPVTVRTQFAVLPSSNARRGTTNTVFDTALGQFVINPAARAKPGVALQYGLSGAFRHNVGASGRVVLDWSAIAIAADDPVRDMREATVALSYERLTRQGSWRVAPTARRAERRDGTDHAALGWRIGATRRLNDRDSLIVAAHRETRRYDSQDFQNGAYGTLSAGLTRAISASLQVSGTVTLEYGQAEAAHLAYEGLSVSASVNRAWTGGLVTGFGLEFGARDYVGDYPLTTRPRRDGTTRVSIDLRHSRMDLGGFLPVLTCGHTLNRSNVAFFDYGATDCGISLTRSF